MNVVFFALAFVGCIALIECCGTSAGGGDSSIIETTTRRHRRRRPRPRRRSRERKQRFEEEGDEGADVGSSTWKQFDTCQKSHRVKCIQRCEKDGFVTKGLAKCFSSHPSTIFRDCAKIDERSLCAEVGFNGDATLPIVEGKLECIAKCFTEDQHGCWEDCDEKVSGTEVQLIKRCYSNAKNTALKTVAECEKQLAG